MVLGFEQFDLIEFSLYIAPSVLKHPVSEDLIVFGVNSCPNHELGYHDSSMHNLKYHYPT